MAIEGLSDDGKQAQSKLVELVPIGDTDFPSMTLHQFYRWTNQHERRTLSVLAMYHDILPGDEGDPLGELHELRGDLMQALIQLRQEVAPDVPLASLYPDNAPPSDWFFADDDEGEEWKGDGDDEEGDDR
jgi:hypothetical protein